MKKSYFSRILATGIWLLFLTGCGVKISYEVTDPNSGQLVKVTYERTGDMKVGRANCRTPDGLVFDFESSESTGMAETWGKGFDTLNEIVKRIPVKQ